MINLMNKEDYNKSGIYIITNKINNKFYIGSATNFRKRYNVHNSNFKKNKNSKYLQRAYNKYGEENFEFQIIDYI